MKARCVDSTGLSRYLSVGKIYYVVDIDAHSIVVNDGSTISGTLNRNRFEIIPDDFNERETLPSMPAYFHVEPVEKNEADFFKPKADNHTCSKCFAPKPCAYHDS